MTKFLSLCATFFVFLVSAVAAIPQEHLAPAAHSEDMSGPFEKRAVPRAPIQNQLTAVHARQVHNADYGSDSGPSGNPHTAQSTTEAASSPTSAAKDSDPASGAADDSSSGKKRRDFDPHPADINHKEEDDS